VLPEVTEVAEVAATDVADVAATEEDEVAAAEVPTDVAAEVPTDPEEVEDVPEEEVEDEVTAADVLLVKGAPSRVEGLLYGLLPLLLVARTLKVEFFVPS